MDCVNTSQDSTMDPEERVNTKQRQRKLVQRQHHGSQVSRLIQDLTRVTAKAKRQKKGFAFIENQMMALGYLTDGEGNWRTMTARERQMWGVKS